MVKNYKFSRIFSRFFKNLMIFKRFWILLTSPQFFQRCFNDFLSTLEKKTKVGIPACLPPNFGFFAEKFKTCFVLISWTSRKNSESLIFQDFLSEILLIFKNYFHFQCHESEHENLQRLAQQVKTSCLYVERTMTSAMRMREKAIRRSEIVNILNSVSNAVLQLAEHTKRFVFWLDRTPFDEEPEFINVRNSVSSFMWNLLRNVNVQPKALFETGSQIVRVRIFRLSMGYFDWKFEF